MRLKRLVFWVVLAGVILAVSGCNNAESRPQITGKVDRLYAPSTYKPTIVPKPVPAVPKAVPPVCRQDKPLSGLKILVDPGHGGHDPGAGKVGYSELPEKTIVLDVAHELRRKLEACGASVKMTRVDDTFVELNERAAMAERYRVDLLISVHADSAPQNGGAYGPTIYIAKQACNTSEQVARVIDRTFSGQGISSRGIKRANFRVLANHSRPAILVECGFLTNYTDAARLNSKWYRQKIAWAISDGVSGAIGK